MQSKQGTPKTLAHLLTEVSGVTECPWFSLEENGLDISFSLFSFSLPTFFLPLHSFLTSLSCFYSFLFLSCWESNRQRTPASYYPLLLHSFYLNYKIMESQVAFCSEYFCLVKAVHPISSSPSLYYLLESFYPQYSSLYFLYCIWLYPFSKCIFPVNGLFLVFCFPHVLHVKYTEDLNLGPSYEGEHVTFVFWGLGDLTQYNSF